MEVISQIFLGTHYIEVQAYTVHCTVILRERLLFSIYVLLKHRKKTNFGGKNCEKEEK